MINAAHELPFAPPEADDFEVEITIRSWKYDCHTAYRLNKHEIEADHMGQIIRSMTYRLQDFIATRNEEKKNAASEGKESKDEKGLLN